MSDGVENRQPLKRGEMYGWPLLRIRPELIDDSYLPEDMRDGRTEFADSPHGAHVEYWRSNICPISDKVEAFEQWLQWELRALSSYARLDSMRTTLGDDSKPCDLDYHDTSDTVLDAYMIVDVLTGQGFEAFPKDRPGGRVTLLQAQGILQHILDWLRKGLRKDSILETTLAVAVDDQSKQQQSASNQWTWRKVRDKLDEIRLTGKGFTSRRDMAKDIGCTLALVQKAIRNGSKELQDWATKERAPSRRNVAPGVSEVILSNTQGREPDPGDMLHDSDVDVTMAKLLDVAAPEEKARINAMTPAEQRQLAEAYYSQEKDAKEHAKGSTKRSR